MIYYAITSYIADVHNRYVCMPGVHVNHVKSLAIICMWMYFTDLVQFYDNLNQI